MHVKVAGSEGGVGVGGHKLFCHLYMAGGAREVEKEYLDIW